MACNYFHKATGIEFTVQDFGIFLEQHFPGDDYLTHKLYAREQAVDEQVDYILGGHHSACECGCLEMSQEERKNMVEEQSIGDTLYQLGLIEINCNDLVFGDSRLIVCTAESISGIKCDHVFVGCSKFLRYQTDYEYECDFSCDELVDRAMRTDFDPAKYPEADEDEIDELRFEFVGELIDISVPVPDNVRDLLSKYGEIKDYCLYGSIYLS